MKFDLLKTRMSRRLSMPPEILYALSRHWMMIFFFLCVGAVASFAVAVSQPPLYLGTATLLFANEPLVVGHGRPDARRAQDRSLSANVQLLLSDSVIRKVVHAVKASNMVKQSSRPPEEEAQSGFRKVVRDLLAYVTEAKDAVWPQKQEDTSEELQVQRAVASFRKRSDVHPNPMTNTVALRIEGGDRDIVERELDEWIKGFSNHVAEMTGQSSDVYISSRKQYWSELEQKARQAVEAFQREYPDATKANQDLLFRELGQLQLMQLDLQRGPKLAGSPQVPDVPRPAEDLERQGLLAQKRTLEAELIQNLPLYTDDSYRIKALRESIALVESKLAALGQERKEPPADELEKLGESIRKTMGRYTEISAQYEKLQSLEEELTRYEETRKSYEVLDMERQDTEELSKSVQVQVSDKPQVSWLPVVASSRKHAAMGGMAGLVISALLALFIEATAGKARFKNDVTGEFGLPVLAVIPKR
jgi:uncharacterized protein involved in exopolysaccharide biosynthesis